MPTFEKYTKPVKLPDSEMALRADARRTTRRQQNARKREKTGNPVGTSKMNDLKFMWVLRDYPVLHEWRDYAVAWLESQIGGIPDRMRAIKVLFIKYLVAQNVPLEFDSFFSTKSDLPEFFETVCPDSKAGAIINNLARDFLEFIRLTRFMTKDQNGITAPMPGYRNPIQAVPLNQYWRPYESVYSTLPYGYIEEARSIINAGPHFRDWVFCQTAMGAEEGTVGGYGADWFPVDEAMIDKADPDCVWRVRKRVHRLGGPSLEMWSPVRWVALFVKLSLPLRTAQVRMLDSGEADTWRYEKGEWVRNRSKLREGTEKRPLQQGVFRRVTNLADAQSAKTVIYINTNKTADLWKNGPEKGFVIHWENKEVLEMLERLRNWQEKYNPIERRTSWAELDTRYKKAMSPSQLASYPDACFLFRLPEARFGNRSFPINETAISRPWFLLLSRLEEVIAKRGEMHSNGDAIHLVYQDQARKGDSRVYYPLHSLRVSLVAALAYEGEVPFPILQRVVGHSRLLMTIYYAKPREATIQSTMTEAMRKLEQRKEKSIIDFLTQNEHSYLIEEAITISRESFGAVVPSELRTRNPAGWMLMHHGICLVGGNTSAVEGNASLGGCHNGGPNTGTEQTPMHGPVPGGSRNCIRCRWFVTEAHYLPSLVAHFNNLAYHFDEARQHCIRSEEVLQEIKREKAESERDQRSFLRRSDLIQTQRIFETAMQRFSDLVEDMNACNHLIERCRAMLNSGNGAGNDKSSRQLLAQGEAEEIRIAFEQTESELLQLAGICEDAEIYPDLEAGKAILRRSQILDEYLYARNAEPLFMRLTEAEQLQCGNAFMRSLAVQMNPDNIVLGLRQAVREIETRENQDLLPTLDLEPFKPGRLKHLVLVRPREDDEQAR